MKTKKRYEYLVGCMVSVGEQVMYNSLQVTTSYKIKDFKSFNRLLDEMKGFDVFQNASVISVMNIQLFGTYRITKRELKRLEEQEFEQVTEEHIIVPNEEVVEEVIIDEPTEEEAD